MLTLRIPLIVSRSRPHLSDASRDRCQRISDLSEEDRSFPRLSSMELLTNVSLIPARVAVELVDALLEMGTVLQSMALVHFFRSFSWS